MLDHSLVNTNFLGRDNFVWWIGQVAHPKYWKNASTAIGEKIDTSKESTSWGYRCKVRIIGYHPFSGTELEDKDLPWAHVMVPLTEGTAQGALGSTLSLVGGECVFGFFLDGDEGQQPVIFGALHRPTSAVSMITDQDILSEKSSAFKPFSAPGARGATQVPASDGGDIPPKPPTPPAASVGVGTTGTGGSEQKQQDKDALSKESVADTQFGEPLNVQIPNGCDQDWFSEITNTIRSFLTTVNSLTSFLGTYVSAVQNALQDIQRLVRKSGLIIIGIIKKILNNLRKKLIKRIVKALKNFLGLTVPDPQLEAITKAINKILDTIFCIFEKLGIDILGFIMNFLTQMVGRTIAAPLCAAEQATAAMISKLLNELDKLLKPILDGISWLVDGLGMVGGVLRQVSSYASMILGFLDCDKLSCKKVVDWSSGWGLSTKAATNISSFLDNVTIMDDLITGGESMTLDQLAAEGESGLSVLTILGGNAARFVRCNQTRDNPRTQDDIGNTPNGYTFPKCIPPKVEIIGQSKKTAKAYAIVSSTDRTIMSIEITDPGLGYKEPPVVSIIDKTNHGGGADAEAIIDSKGSVVKIYLRDPGIGYCLGNTYWPKGKEPEEYEDVGLPDTDPPKIRFTTPNDDSVGIDTGINFSITFNEPVYTNLGRIVIKESKTNAIFADIDINDASQISFNTRYTLVVNPKDNLKFDTEYYINMTQGCLTDVAGNKFLGINDKETYNFSTKAQAGISSVPVGIITSIVVDKPGIGYTSGDKGQYGDCKFDLVLNPSGSVIGITNIVCASDRKYTSIPTATINSREGYGAKLLPVVDYSPDITSGDDITPRARDLVIKVIDCPTRSRPS